MRVTHEFLASANNHLQSLTTVDVIRWIVQTFRPGEVTMATGFGMDGVVVLDLLLSQSREIPVFYLDTDLLFPETYQLRDKLEERYNIRFLRVVSDLSLELQSAIHGHHLWDRNPDLCCNIRKVQPLSQALEDRAAWITAIRRDQSPTRKDVQIVEWDRQFGLLKINPLAFWTRRDVWDYINRTGLPYNVLHDMGYSSIGCIHCTQPVQKGEHERAGRWRDFEKTECGIHLKNSNASKP